jgi:hypothetical protein
LHPGSIPGEASKQINGLLEVSHWAKKLVSHPSEFCFAAESAAALGLWGRAEEKRPQGEEWISAAEALALVKIPRQHAARAICNRAHAGLVRARAERYVSDNQISYNIDVPIEFWWAEGGAALTQNWHTGDFETWLRRVLHLQAFGVTFYRSDIERLQPKNNEPLKRPAEVMGGVSPVQAPAGKRVFIGHGRSLLWRELKDFLRDDLNIDIEEFNNVPAAGIATVARLREMLDAAAFAFLIMTAEDETPDRLFQARLNVIHEVGLFKAN